jgi:hypothetical protein
VGARSAAAARCRPARRRGGTLLRQVAQVVQILAMAAQGVKAA